MSGSSIFENMSFCRLTLTIHLYQISFWMAVLTKEENCHREDKEIYTAPC